MWDYRAQLIRIIDGDTIVVTCDQGMHGRQEEHIRLKNVNAPDSPKPGTLETTQYVASWISSLDWSLRWPLYVITTPNTQLEPEEKRTFIRYEAMIYDIRDYKVNPFDMDSEKSLNLAVNKFLASHPEWSV